MYHGITKFGSMEGVIGFFQTLGFAPFLAYLVATIETLGGLLLILGIFPRVVASLFAVIMLVAIFKVKGGDFKKAELDVVLLFVSAAIFCLDTGSIKLSLGKKA